MIGARLKQARLLAGMTQPNLSKALGDVGYDITVAAISKYENDKSFPPVRFMLLASNILNVPSAYFSHQAEKSVTWAAFRRTSKLGKTQQETIMAKAADLAELHIELLSLLHPHSSPELPQPVPVSKIEDVEQVAEQLRETWDVGNRPLDNLVQTAEDRGVILIGWHDESGHFDGLSGWCDEYPVTVINTNRSTDRIRFSFAHEIGHLVLDTSALGPLDEERMANRFAGAFLVPKAHAIDELGAKRDHLDWCELMILKRKYGLSMAAWITRAKDLGIVSKHLHANMFKELNWKKWRKQEPVEYLGDEEPLQLKQMIQRAVAEGLVSPDRMTRIGVDVWEPELEPSESEHVTVYDLLAMPEDERQAVMDRAFELAADYDFEIFEADEFYELEDFDDEARR